MRRQSYARKHADDGITKETLQTEQDLIDQEPGNSPAKRKIGIEIEEVE